MTYFFAILGTLAGYCAAAYLGNRIGYRDGFNEGWRACKDWNGYKDTIQDVADQIKWEQEQDVEFPQEMLN